MSPFLTLDPDDVVVDVGKPAVAEFGHLLGQRLWDAAPGAEPVFRPYYERARRTGEPLEFVQFFDGRLERVEVVPRGSLLDIRWESLATIDTLTLDGLRVSMNEAVSTLERQEHTARRAVVRSSLRVLDGGG